MAEGNVGLGGFIQEEVRALESELSGLVESHAVVSQTGEEAVFQVTTLEGESWTITLSSAGYACTCTSHPDKKEAGEHETLISILFAISPAAQSAFHAQLVAQLVGLQ